MLSSATGIDYRNNGKYISIYDKTLKIKTGVPCPQVIKSYNQNMGGVAKCDML